MHLERWGTLACSLAILLAILPACGDAVAERGTEPVVRDSAGIRIVESAEPRWRAGEAWRLSDQPVLVIGMVEGPEAYQLDRVNGVLLRHDGSVVVANGGSQTLRFYDAEGRHLRDAGGPGGGPGEFQMLWGVYAVPGDSIAAWDGRAKRLTVFSASGDFARDLTLEALPGMAAPFRGILSDGSAVASPGPDPVAFREMAPGARRDTAVFLRFDREGALIDTIGSVPGQETVVFRSSNMFGNRQVPFGRSAHAAVAGGLLHAGENDAFEIRTHEPGRGIARILRRPHQPRPVSEADLEAMRASQAEGRMSVQVQVQARTGSGAAPSRPAAMEEPPHRETMPAFSRILADGAGNVWVRHYSPPGDDGPSTWSVFDAEGHWLGEVSTPAGLNVMQIGEDAVAGVWKDELDVEHVHVYALTRG